MDRYFNYLGATVYDISQHWFMLQSKTYVSVDQLCTCRLGCEQGIPLPGYHKYMGHFHGKTGQVGSAQTAPPTIQVLVSTSTNPFTGTMLLESRITSIKMLRAKQIHI